MGADFTIKHVIIKKKISWRRSATTTTAAAAKSRRHKRRSIRNYKRGLNVVVDCVGTENTIYDSVRLLSKEGVQYLCLWDYFEAR